jgi:GDP/UDP-N,N'-diacetylbacillosamine 2-epimerase (hydrolysing)
MDDEYFDFGIIVAGTHLSDYHNQTLDYIEDDGLKIVSRLNNFTNDDNYASQVISASNLLQSIVKVIEDFKPELLIAVGDREDALIMAIAGTYLRVPVVHFYGGDHASDGHVDNLTRHAISKLAQFHFVSTELHKTRLIKLGEESSRIRVIGSIALDKFKDEVIVTRSEVLYRIFQSDNLKEKSLAFMLYHPITSELGDFKRCFTSTLDLLNDFDLHLIVGKSNNDPKYLELSEFLSSFISNPRIHFVDVLDRNTYVNFMRNIDLMIGNSSAGVLESPSLKLPAINIGIRQIGRDADRNVIFSRLSVPEIEASLCKALSISFKKSLLDLKNSYGDGESADRAIFHLKQIASSDLSLIKLDPMEISE